MEVGYVCIYIYTYNIYIFLQYYCYQLPHTFQTETRVKIAIVIERGATQNIPSIIQQITTLLEPKKKHLVKIIEVSSSQERTHHICAGTWNMWALC